MSTLVDKSEFPLLLGSFSENFGYNCGARAPVEKEVSQKLTITNKTQKKISWKIFPDNCEKYTFRIFPNTGKLIKVK